MGKANEEKSGDRLAGVAAENTAERAAAKFVLAEVPLHALRARPLPLVPRRAGVGRPADQLDRVGGPKAVSGSRTDSMTVRAITEP